MTRRVPGWVLPHGELLAWTGPGPGGVHIVPLGDPRVIVQPSLEIPGFVICAAALHAVWHVLPDDAVISLLQDRRFRAAFRRYVAIAAKLPETKNGRALLEALTRGFEKVAIKERT